MSSETTTLKASGLYTFAQTLMETPPGALLKANNVVIDRDGVIEKRRGMGQYSGINSSPPKQLMEYKSRIISHIQNKIAYDNGNGIFTNFQGNYLEPFSGYRINSVEARGNFYFTTSSGIKKLSAKTAADFSSDSPSNFLIEDAGGPNALGGVAVPTNLTGFYNTTDLLVPPNSSVNYQILWLYTDRNDNLIFGSPSQIIPYKNTTINSVNVRLVFNIPSGVKYGYKYRIYRSEISSPSGIASAELFQIYEATYDQNTPVLINTIEVIDNYPADLLSGGVPLYTNQNSGEGILKANLPPPAARDLALFKGHLFYGNTRTRYSTLIQLIDNSNLINRPLIINPDTGLEYSIDFTPGVSIEETARNIVSAINFQSPLRALTPSSQIQAYYLSNRGEPPGKILIESVTLDDFQFSITCPLASANFSPNLGTRSSPLLSKNEKVGNRLYWSKYQEHEAVPLLNYADVGGKDQEIERIVSLRESLFIFKRDGVYRLAGEPGANPIWDISLLDNTAWIEAPDSVTILKNQCYFFGPQGVYRLNETSIDPVSTPIKNKIVPFIANNPNIKTLSFSVPYETDNSLLFFTCLTNADTVASVCYRYNTTTQAWTEWKMRKTCGIVSRFGDKLYLGSAIAGEYYIEKERKSFTRLDYCDYQLTSSLIANRLYENILYPENFSNISVGDVIAQIQYVTIYQFNSLLKKLDLDSGINFEFVLEGTIPNQVIVKKSVDYYENFKVQIGTSLSDKMTQLINKLNSVDGTAVYTFNGTTNPQTFQTEFNNTITKLNTSSVKTNFKNYELSQGTITQEVIIVSINSLESFVILNKSPSFLLGDLVIYKNIPVEVEYAPQHANDPASFKQFSSATFMFERRSFYSAEISFNSDISEAYETITLQPRNSGTFGNSIWGEEILWGGIGDQSNVRTLVPLKKQRCRFLGCKFLQSVALETFQLYGISLAIRLYAISNRDYK